MKIGITGGKGFLGSHLIAALQKGRYQFELFEAYGISILDKKAMEKFVKEKDVIIHLAGKNRGDPYAMYQANLLGTLVLLESIREHSPDTAIIFASSVQVYVKDSLYGLSKKQAEELFHFFSISYDVKCIILRFTNLYGIHGRPFYNSVISTFVYLVKTGKKITINGDGRTKRDYLHVQDAVSAILRSLNYKMLEKHVAFDICSGRKYSLNHILKILRSVTGNIIEVSYEKSSQNPWRFRANSERAKRLLGWKPEVSLNDGLRQLMKDEN